MSIFAPKPVNLNYKNEDNFSSATSSAAINYGAGYSNLGSCLGGKNHNLVNNGTSKGLTSLTCNRCSRSCTVKLGSNGRQRGGYDAPDRIKQRIDDLLEQANANTENSANQRMYGGDDAASIRERSQVSSSDQLDDREGGLWGGAKSHRDDNSFSDATDYDDVDRSSTSLRNSDDIESPSDEENSSTGGAKSKYKRRSSNNGRKTKRSSSKQKSTRKNSRSSSQRRSSQRRSSKQTRKRRLSRDPNSPDPLAKYREYVAYIQKDMNLKGGPVAIAFASYFRGIVKKDNPTASQDELNEKAKKLYHTEKAAGRASDIYEKVKKDLENKRIAKKQKKAAEKAAAKQIQM